MAEFLNFAGLAEAPRARIALLPCDKLDVNEGLEVYGPDGRIRRVRTLWGALAYQLAGDAGYARLKAHDDELTVPAEPILVDLLHEPQKAGLGSLVLVDEAVWYYRQLVLKYPHMLGAIKDFYQVLNQAVAKVDRASMVASLIASQVEADDQTGTQCLNALNDVFQRVGEPLEPVTHDDVAEVLRRRLFKSVAGPAERRPAIDAMMVANQRLPLRETQREQAAYDRMMASYPFHPDLIEVLYQKWTQLSGFQRTRGALRLLSYALRDSASHDSAPMVGPGALLLPASKGEGGLSAALNELVEICEESRKWTPILVGELEKVRELQAGLPTLRARELEQAVAATFLHSQPTGQRAAHTELLAMLAHPNVDAAALEEGLRKWRERSWFLVEDPDTWQLGTTANLTHMHVRAMEWLSEKEIDDELERRIRNVSTLKAADPGVEVHVLPQSPNDIKDNAVLHYLILSPGCAVELGKPLPAVATAYFNQKSGPNDPRIQRNNVLALVPEVSRVAGLREQVRRWLGWARLEKPDVFNLLSDSQKKKLPKEKEAAANNLPEAVVGAYHVLLALDENGTVQAQALRTDRELGGTPFERIKTTLAGDERLVTTTLDPDLILPGSYLALWGEGQTARRVTDLMQAFGQFPRLPRLLRPESLYDTLRRGVQEGVLVLRLPRADGSSRTWWRIPPDADTLARPELEVVPAASAQLTYVEPELFKPGVLAGLWPAANGPLPMATLADYFDGKRAPRLAGVDVLVGAVAATVRRGLLMARIEHTSLYQEELPDGPLPDDLELLPSPSALNGADLTAQALPEAWQGTEATLQSIVDVLAKHRGYSVPWAMISRAVDEALSLKLLQRADTSMSWPCSPVAADQVLLRIPEEIELSPEAIVQALKYTGTGAPTLRAVKEVVENQFFGGRTILLETFTQQAQAALSTGLLEKVDAATTKDLLGTRVRQPAKVLYAEATFDLLALERLAEKVGELISLAPQLNYAFRVSLTAEGQPPDDETYNRLNEVLSRIRPGWKLA